MLNWALMHCARHVHVGVQGHASHAALASPLRGSPRAAVARSAAHTPLVTACRPQQGRRKHAPDRSSMQQAGPARTFSRPPSRARRALSFSHAAAHQTGMRNRLDRLQADCAQTQELLAGQLSRLTGLADGREAETSVDARSLADSAEGETDRRMQYGNAAAAAAQETFLDAVRRIQMAARKKSPDAQPQAASQLQGCFDQATASPSVVWPQLGSCQSAPGRMVDPRTAYSAREALRGGTKINIADGSTGSAGQFELQRVRQHAMGRGHYTSCKQWQSIRLDRYLDVDP